MAEAREFGRPLLLRHALFMLSLGIALFTMANSMTDPKIAESGYTLAVISLSVGLLAAGYISYRGRIWAIDSQRTGRIYWFAGGLTMACGLLFWIGQLPKGQVHALPVITALYGVYWGMWNFGLARHLQDHPRKGIVLCVFAGITSAVCLIMTTEFQFTGFEAVTELACFLIAIGIQGLLIVLYLYHDMDNQKILGLVPQESTQG